jgi:hypothetical protein
MKTHLDILGRHIDLAARSRRRWLLALIYAGFAGMTIVWSIYGLSWFGLVFLLVFILVARAIGGKTYRGGLVPAFESGDEREQNRRDRAFYVAYKWWDLTLLPAMAAVGLKNNAFYPGWDPAVRTFVDRLPYGLLIAAGILYYTLPQAILLWTEPDMEKSA